MGLFAEIRYRARYVIGPFLGICMVGYFAYHAVEGERGLMAMASLERELADAKDELATLTNDREALERRVRLLHPEHLDPDMLEERARAMLNFGYPDDVVVILTP